MKPAKLDGCSVDVNTVDASSGPDVTRGCIADRDLGQLTEYLRNAASARTFYLATIYQLYGSCRICWQYSAPCNDYGKLLDFHHRLSRTVTGHRDDRSVGKE